MQGLTERQRSILEYIRAHIASKGYPPTLREIGKRFSIRSTNGVNDHLIALERKGYLLRRDMLARGMRLVKETGGLEASPVDALTCSEAENEALRTLLRRLVAAGARAPTLTAELVILIGDARAVVSRAS